VRHENLHREEILGGNDRGIPLAKLSWTWEWAAQEQHQDRPPDPGDPLSPQTAADEGETTEQSVWSSYAQAHHVMIADPGTLQVLQGVPAVRKVDEQREVSQVDADLQDAGDDVLAKEQAPEAVTYDARYTRGMGGQGEQQDSLDWSEVEAVLVAAAAAVEEGAADSTADSTADRTESGLEEEAADEGAADEREPQTAAADATFAELASRLSGGGGGAGAWDRLSALASSFALNAIDGLSPDKGAANL
jgi:hypothetical protein